MIVETFPCVHCRGGVNGRLARKNCFAVMDTSLVLLVFDLPHIMSEIAISRAEMSNFKFFIRIIASA